MRVQYVELSAGCVTRHDGHGGAIQSQHQLKGDAMSKETRQFLEQLKRGEEPKFIESIKDAASSFKDIGGQIWDGVKPMWDHGRSEIAAFLFGNHQGHVMYMRAQGGGEQEQNQDQVKEMSEDQRDLGREM